MDTPFFDSLIDNFGIWQHTDGQAILKDEGYALDDAARGLLVCLALKHTTQATVLFTYLQKSYHKAQFYGFATADRTFHQYPASDDATGQVIWAAGYAYSLGFHTEAVKKIIKDCRLTLTSFEYVRGYAYALLGLIYVDKILAKQVAEKLLDYFKYTDDTWLWPEPVMTYGNGIIPYALLRYGLVTGDTAMSTFGLKVCTFVQKQCELGGRLLAPIGNDGWLPKGSSTVPEYSQQPIDAAYMTWAWLAAYQCFDDTQYYKFATQWLQWFEGKNSKGESMYNPLTQKCFDGIDKTGVHYHSGAESNICWILTHYLLKQKTTI